MGCQSETQHTAPIRSGRAAAGTGTTASSKNTAGAHTWHMKKAEWPTQIGYDAMPMYGIPAMPMKKITGMSMLIPTDWSFKVGTETGVASDCNFTTGRLIVLSASPDNKSALLIKPGHVSVWSTNRGLLQNIAMDNQSPLVRIQHCTVEPSQPLANRIAGMAKGLLPTAVVDGPMEAVPEIDSKLGPMLTQANQSLAQQAAQTGRPAPRLSAEAGRMHLTSHDASGDGEGYIYVLQTTRTEPLPGGGELITTDVPMQFLAGTSVGKLKEMEPMFQAMVASMWVNPEYQAACLQVAGNLAQIYNYTKQRLQQIASNMAADNARTAARIADIQRGVQQYRSQVMSNVSANRSAALEHSSQQFSLYMGDQAIYKDSATGQRVQLPSGYNHVWTSTTGNTNEYILTDSPSYNPNGQVGSAGWSQMQEQR